MARWAIRARIEVKFVGDDPNQGVLHIRTPALMSGYLNREADTRKRLIDGWYDTGDVMARRERLRLRRPGDDMFQCGGENVYPGEVEKLLGRHADVAQVCARAGGRRDQVPAPRRLRRAEARNARRPRTRCAASPSTTAGLRPSTRGVVRRRAAALAGTNKIDRRQIDRAAAAHARRHGSAWGSSTLCLGSTCPACFGS